MSSTGVKLVGDSPLLFERTVRGSFRFAVLGSSSGGNCSAIMLPSASDGPGELVLIDAGFGPRVLRQLLELAGLGQAVIRAVVLTHLDVDHANPVTLGGLPRETPVYMPKRHAGRAHRDGIRPGKIVPFTDDFEPADGLVFSPHLTHHDSLGVAAFRVRVNAESGTTTLGYATDLGRPTPELAAHLRGVDVLALESNYCPRMQADSDRPEFLKQRITGGSGHLSNQQSAQLASDIAPGRLSLLHLSRQCNTPELALAAHRGKAWEVEAAAPRQPTGWIELKRPTLS